MPSEVQLIRAQAILEPLGDERRLDFSNLDDQTTQVATRFLKGALENPLFALPTLWMPMSGGAFFDKVPDREFASFDSDAHLYRGFRFRLLGLAEGKIGVVVDTTFKYVGRQYLPSRIQDDYFRRIKNRKAIYEYGRYWPEINILGMEGLSVSEVKLPNGTVLYDELQRVGPNSYQVRSLPKDASVLTYYTKSGELRRAPAGLCRLTYDTKNPSVRRLHGSTIRDPQRRKEEIDFVVDKYLTGWKFGEVRVALGDPVEIATKRFSIPRLRFGNGAVLTTNPNLEGTFAELSDFGRAKQRLASSIASGFYVRKGLDRQYLVLPSSVESTFGSVFRQDLNEAFLRLYGNSTGFAYDPTVLTYDDSVPHSIPALGREILRSVESNFIFDGYALVMIPRLSYGERKEDELANLVMRELRKKGVNASIIHNEVSRESYRAVGTSDHKQRWVLSSDPDTRRRFPGYLQNVVLNKILVPSSCWPFVLQDGLHADLTIGIDVKNNTAGFTFVYKDGKSFRFFSSDSEESESLGKAHLRTKLQEFISEESTLLNSKPQSIVVQRDGRLHPEEIPGIREAMGLLKKEGYISPQYDLNLVEIRKFSSLPVKFFMMKEEAGSQREMATNPIIGEYVVMGNDAYVATTGAPYLRRGTARPLHVVRVAGKMPYEHILHDIFNLSNLTFTKMDSCSRLPFTLKMTDIRLREVAGWYHKDLLKFGGLETAEVE